MFAPPSSSNVTRGPGSRIAVWARMTGVPAAETPVCEIPEWRPNVVVYLQGSGTSGNAQFALVRIYAVSDRGMRVEVGRGRVMQDGIVARVRNPFAASRMIVTLQGDVNPIHSAAAAADLTFVAEAFDGPAGPLDPVPAQIRLGNVLLHQITSTPTYLWEVLAINQDAANDLWLYLYDGVPTVFPAMPTLVTPLKVPLGGSNGDFQPVRPLFFPNGITFGFDTTDAGGNAYSTNGIAAFTFE